MSTSHNRYHLSDALILESVRLIEETGPLEDNEAMHEAFRSSTGREERLIARAKALSPRFKFGAEIERWREVAPYVWIALAIAVFFLAYGIAAAVIGGDRSINAVLAFFVALGMHAATLLVWLAALAATTWSRHGAFGRISLGSLFFRLVVWLPPDRGPHSLTLYRAANSLLQREKLLPWAFGFISHSIWAFAFLLVLGALWLAFSFQAYRLTWETTILDADFFVGFVQVTGWLPHLLGFPLPDTATLLDPGAAGSDHRAWAWWLIGCIVVYGFIPRFVLAVFSWLVWRRRSRSLSIDTSDPYFRKLLARFGEMEESIVVDREHRAEAGSKAGAAPFVPDIRKALVIVGFELPEEYPWPPPALVEPGDHIERIAGSSEERRSILNMLAQAAPQKILLVCNQMSSPDRGTERFIRELCARAGECGLLLFSIGTAGENADRWKRWLKDIGMSDMPAFTDPHGASVWCRMDHV